MIIIFMIMKFGVVLIRILIYLCYIYINWFCFVVVLFIILVKVLLMVINRFYFFLKYWLIRSEVKVVIKLDMNGLVRNILVNCLLWYILNGFWYF